MAGDSALTVNTAVLNSKVTVTGAKSLHDTGDIYLDVSTMDGSKVGFYATRAGAKNPTIVVYDGGEYSAGSVGNYSFASTAAGTYFLGPFETARFKDSDGYIRIGKSTADTAVISITGILYP
jgi:hypothetical protein